MRWLLALWLAIAPACAQEAIIGSGVSGGVKAASTYTGPGDIASGASSWESCARAYNAAYATGTNKACNLRNTGTNETCDVLIATSGSAATTVTNCSGSSSGNSIATFCSGGCAATKYYDQSGNSRDVSQATAANQPSYSATGIGSQPAISATTSSMALKSAANFTPSTGVMSFEMVYNRSSGTTSGCGVSANSTSNSNDRFGPPNSANNIILGGSSSFTATSSDAANHSVNAVLNGASSVINVDGTETAGTAAGNTTAGLTCIDGPQNSSLTIKWAEGGFWDNVTFTSGQRTSLCKNGQAYYGAGNFGATC